MKQKLISMLSAIVLIIGLIPVGAMAGYTLPTKFGAPEDFTVHFYEDGFEKTWIGFEASVSASKELRSFLDDVVKEGSPFAAAGYNLTNIVLQLDYKLDGGNWHYKSDWDDKLDYMPNMSEIRLTSGKYSASTIIDKGQFENFTPGETLPDKRAFFDSHSMDFKVRFIVNSQDNNGTYYRYASPWSEAFTYNNKKTAAVDPAKLINHAPVLKSVELKKLDDGRPYLHVVTEKAHEDLRQLNSLSNDGVTTELWIKVGSGEWVTGGQDNFVEQFDVQAMEAYFGLKDNYADAIFDVKVRYCFDIYRYPGKSEISQMIYSPFSNILSIGTPAYSNASTWAKAELDKADSYGLIPESLKGADMTRPITREEFAELAVKLYEKTTGKAANAASPNPFTDTTNLEILKAFKLGITQGTSTTTFSPKELTNREQVATMLSRAIRFMVPNGDFSTEGSQTFSDQKDISSWALEHVQFMSKAGIITGSEGKFMPKAQTTAEVAEGYGTTTREQALAMSARIYNKYK